MDSGPGPSVQSITEQTDLDDFLATAELAGTEFAAGKSYLYSCTPAPVNGGGGGGGGGGKGGGFFGGTVCLQLWCATLSTLKPQYNKGPREWNILFDLMRFH